MVKMTTFFLYIFYHNKKKKEKNTVCALVPSLLSSLQILIPHYQPNFVLEDTYISYLQNNKEKKSLLFCLSLLEI